MYFSRKQRRVVATTRRARLRAVTPMAIVLVVLSPDSAKGDRLTGVPWPEADVLFHRDSRWRGADAANSIDLGDGRVLWTFGDTFISIDGDPSRRKRQSAHFVRNTVAIQTGYDPTSAEFCGYWQTNAGGKPTSFFRGEGEDFFWPGGGLLVDDQLLIFLMRIQNATTGLGFRVLGWGAVLVDNPLDTPTAWRMSFLETPPFVQNILVGSGSALRQGDWVYAYGADLSRPHRLFLTRFAVDRALDGDLWQPQWWMGAGCGWIAHDRLAERKPCPVVESGPTEFTVHFEPRVERLLLTQFAGFPQSPIATRQADKLTGPWTPMRAVYCPEEFNEADQDLMIYAAKAHPEQLADGLAVTYCTNTYSLTTVRTNESLYYPRFLRLVKCSQANDSAR